MLGSVTHVVDEPGDGQGSQLDPVALEDKPVGDLGVAHRVLLVGNGLDHKDTSDQEDKRGNESKEKGATPDGTGVVETKDPEKNQAHKPCNGKGKVEHGVGGPDEQLLLVLLGHAGVLGRLGGSDRSGRVLASEADTQEEAECDEAVDHDLSCGTSRARGEDGEDEDDASADEHGKLAANLV